MRQSHRAIHPICITYIRALSCNTVPYVIGARFISPLLTTRRLRQQPEQAEQGGQAALALRTIEYGATDALPLHLGAGIDGQQGDAQIVLGTQRDERLESWLVVGRGLRRVALVERREDHLRLKLRKGHADADARSPAEGEVRAWGYLLAVRWVPALRAELFGFVPDFGCALNDPLAKHEQRSGWQVYAVEFEVFGDEAQLHPGGREEAQRLAQYPVEIGHLAYVFDGRSASGEDRADLFPQLLAHGGMLREQVDRPGDGVGGRLVTSGQKRQDMIVDLLIREDWLLGIAAGARYKHREDIIVRVFTGAALGDQGVDQNVELAHGCAPFAIACDRIVDADIQQIFSGACLAAEEGVEGIGEWRKLAREIDAEEALAHNAQRQFLH